MLKTIEVGKNAAKYSAFETHMCENICGDSEGRYADLLAWVREVVHGPYKPSDFVLVLRGPHGSGKSVFLGMVESMLPETGYTSVPHCDELSRHFNARWARSRMVTVEDARSLFRLSGLATLKPLLTDNRLLVEYKGRDAEQIAHQLHFATTTTHTPALDTSTFEVFDVTNHAQDGAFFGDMLAQWENGGREAFMEDLKC